MLLSLASLGMTLLAATAGDTAEESMAANAGLELVGRALRPLNEKKRPPGEGDWLARFPWERHQSLEAYRASNPNRPTERLTTIYVQPIGPFSVEQARVADRAIELLGIFYNVPVKRLVPLELASIPPRARRRNPQFGMEQLLTTHILGVLRKRCPADAVAVIGLTATDLYPQDDWNFVLGQASLRDRVGVWSLHRFGDPATEPVTCLRRTLSVAIHETGHMLGIRHCVAWECGMNGSNSLEESDRQPLPFCVDCERKVLWACRADPVARYHALADFAGANGLEAERKFWERSRAAVEAAGR